MNRGLASIYPLALVDNILQKKSSASGRSSKARQSHHLPTHYGPRDTSKGGPSCAPPSSPTPLPLLPP